MLNLVRSEMNAASLGVAKGEQIFPVFPVLRKQGVPEQSYDNKYRYSIINYYPIIRSTSFLKEYPEYYDASKVSGYPIHIIYV